MMWLVHWAFWTLYAVKIKTVFIGFMLSISFCFQSFHFIKSHCDFVKFFSCSILTDIFWLGIRSGKAISDKGKRVHGLQGTTVDKTWSETRVWNQPFENGKGIHYINTTRVINMIKSQRKYRKDCSQIIKVFPARTIGFLSLLPAGRTWT